MKYIKRILLLIITITVALSSTSCKLVKELQEVNENEKVMMNDPNDETNLGKVDKSSNEVISIDVPISESGQEVDEPNPELEKAKEILMQLLAKYYEASGIFHVGLDGNEIEVSDEHNVIYVEVDEYSSVEEIKSIAEDVFSKNYRELIYQDNLEGESPRYKDINGVLYTQRLDGFSTNLSVEHIVSVNSNTDTQMELTMRTETGAGDWYKILIILVYEDNKWCIDSIQYQEEIENPYLDMVREIIEQLLPDYREVCKIYSEGLESTGTIIYDENRVPYQSIISEEYQSGEDLKEAARRAFSNEYVVRLEEEYLSGASPLYKEIEGILCRQELYDNWPVFNSKNIAIVETKADTKFIIRISNNGEDSVKKIVLVTLINEEDGWRINSIN